MSDSAFGPTIPNPDPQGDREDNMRPRWRRHASLRAFGAAFVIAVGCSAVQAQTATKEETLVAHRYHAGRTASVLKEVDEQATSALEARRDLARTRFSEYRAVPGPRGLSLARTFLDEAGTRLHARGLDSCRMTETSVDCPTHYLSPGYPRIYLRLRYGYDKTEIDLELQAIQRAADGQTVTAEGRLSLEDAEWYQRLFLRLVDLTMGSEREKK